MSDPDDLDHTVTKGTSLPAKQPGQRVELEQLPVEQEGRYALPPGTTDAELGRGGMGRVLALHDTHLERAVAVKELLPAHLPGRSAEGVLMAAMFVREARILARLEHPGVVPVYELARRADGTPYYSMRRIRGRPFHEVLEACASLDDRLALLPHLLDVVHAVAFAHSRGVVHRDLKPDNVMVGRYGETQVVDWGLALVEGVDEMGGVTAGTPRYMSPEQVLGTGLDARTDVWSLGVMLFELLTGELPFDGANVAEVMDKVARAPVPKVRAVEPRAPKELAELVAKALQRDVAQRYPNAGAMAEAFEKAMLARRRRPVALVAGGGALAVAAVAALGWGLSVQGDSERVAQHARLEVGDAQRDRGRALAEAALASLRARDVAGAREKAEAALKAGPEPLASGVLMLAAERGAPERRWSTTVAAGCSSLAVVGATVACGTLNGVGLFGLEDGKEAGELSIGPRGWQHAVVALGEGQLASGGDDRVLHVWDVAGRKQVRELQGFAGGLMQLASDGPALVVGLRSGEVLRVDGEKQTPLWKHPSSVRALAVQGDVVASASSGLLRWRKGEAGAPAELDRAALALTFAPGGRLLAGVEREVLVLEDGAAHALLRGHRDEVTALGVAGERLVSGAGDGVLRWWFPDGSLDGQLAGFEPGVQALVALPDSVLVATRKRKLERWALPKPDARLPDDGVPTAHAFSSTDWLLSGMRDGRVRKFDRATGAVSWVEAHHDGAVRALAQVPGVRRPEALRHLSGGDDGQVMAQRWNGEVTTLDHRDARVTALAVDDRGLRAAWGYDDGTLVVWSLEFGKEISREQAAVARALAFSPDGATLAAGRDDKRVALFAADTGKQSGELAELDGPGLAVAWSADGKRLFSGGTDGKIVTWDVATKQAGQQWANARDRIVSLDVSAEGLVAAGSDDGEVYVYSPQHGLVAEVPADLGDALAVHFVDAKTLFAAGSDRLLHFWPLP